MVSTIFLTFTPLLFLNDPFFHDQKFSNGWWVSEKPPNPAAPIPGAQKDCNCATCLREAGNLSLFGWNSACRSTKPSTLKMPSWMWLRALVDRIPTVGISGFLQHKFFHSDPEKLRNINWKWYLCCFVVAFFLADDFCFSHLSIFFLRLKVSFWTGTESRSTPIPSGRASHVFERIKVWD